MKITLRDKLTAHIDKLKERGIELSSYIEIFSDREDYFLAGKYQVERNLVDKEINELSKLL